MNQKRHLENQVDENSWWDKHIGANVSLFGKPFTKNRIFNMYWLWDARQGRGSGYLNELRLTTYIPVVGVILLLFPQIPKWSLPWMVLAFFIGTYTLGYIDEKWIRYWHFDNEKNHTHDIFPYDRRIEKRLINIERKLDIDYEKPPYELELDK